MNDNEKPIQTEKSGLDERKKSALLRYVAIMFAVAFVLVLFSLLGQMRNSMSAISELNQTSSSALQKAEQLQEDNLELELDNLELKLENEELAEQLQAQQETTADLQAQIEDLQKQLKAGGEQNEDLQERYDRLQQEMDRLKKELDIQSEDYDLTVQAYERLAELFYAIVSGEASANALLPEFQKIGDHLGAAAHEVFEYLCSRGE